jgi:predicted metal-dependent peptidase
VSANEKIQKIINHWFLSEPVLMIAFLSHELIENKKIDSMRTGKGVIEFNPDFIFNISQKDLEENMKVQSVRILLRHPYRLPENFNKTFAYIASNLTLNEYVNFRHLPYKVSDIFKDKNFEKKSFEFYYVALQTAPVPATEPSSSPVILRERAESITKNTSNKNNRALSIATPSSQESLAQTQTALWQQDDFLDQKIREIITLAQSSMSWGSLSADFINTLIASLRPEIDYKKILQSFRMSVLSSKNVLTRFKPSRRYGFLYCGKKNTFTTKLLIGIDTSGSISEDDLDLFYSTINQFFKYGIESLSVLQFDSEIKGDILSVKKAQKEIQIKGRGGTSFQPIIDYFSKTKNYDGLIIFTDGYAAKPEINPKLKKKILWICDNKNNYGSHNKWMKKLGRCCWIRRG